MSLKEKQGSSSGSVGRIDSTVQTETVQGSALKKRFNFWTAVGVAVCTSGACWAWTASIAQGLSGGGSVGIFWGWIFVSCGIVCMTLSLAEFVSMWPSAGGQYVWAANLAPPAYSRVFSWITAWAGLAGMWLGALSCGIGVGVQIQAYVIVSRPEYDPKTWHVFLICAAVVATWMGINIFAVKSIHYINTIALGLHLVGYFVVIIVLAFCTPEKQTAKFVFTDFQNHTGWDSDFVSWCVGLLAALYAFFSLDSASHYAEEIDRANVLVPRAMILQSVGSTIMTVPFIITVMFCLGNIEDVLSSPIGYLSPFTQIIINSTGSVAGGITLNMISSSIAWVAGVDLWGAASRSIWSMARDNALPSVFAQIHPRWQIPLWANLVLVVPSLLVYIIYIWNTTAFYGIMSGVLVAFQTSYVLPIGLYVFYTSRTKRLVKGPFTLGRFSWPIQAVSFVFGCFMIVMMSFPVYQPVTAENMNYACLLLGAVFVLAALLWFLYGSKRYQGATSWASVEGVVGSHSEDQHDPEKAAEPSQ